jgi:glutathione peroxidase
MRLERAEILMREVNIVTTSLYDIPLQQIDGKGTSLGKFRGKVLLAVNVASKCGLTPQYRALEDLYQSRRAQGLEVLGADQHPLYSQLTAAQPAAVGDGAFRERLQAHGINAGKPLDVLWNFEKFLINRKGNVVARFAPDVTADDPRIVAAIDAALASA